MMPSTVAVVGEALVDEFHDGPVAGGAPFNVARSLAALGAPVRFISRIGADDANGRLVLASAQTYGLDDLGIQHDPAHPTGRVSVHETPGAGHRFEIHADAAWDHLDAALAQTQLLASGAGLLYFGTLAQRAPVSRSTLVELAGGFAGLRLLDLNLRAMPHVERIALESLALADWLKINDEELTQLSRWLGIEASDEKGIGTKGEI